MHKIVCPTCCGIDVHKSFVYTFTDAVNIFIQQSINSNGLPFLASAENEEYLKAKAVRRLMEEFQKGWESGEKDGWVSLDEVEALLGIDDV